KVEPHPLAPPFGLGNQLFAIPPDARGEVTAVISAWRIGVGLALDAPIVRQVYSAPLAVCKISRTCLRNIAQVKPPAIIEQVNLAAGCDIRQHNCDDQG